MSNFETMYQHRDALLLAYVGALLHNLGKISSQFIHKQLGSGSDTYLYQHILQLIAPHCSSLPGGFWDEYANLTDSDILEPDTKSAMNNHRFSLSKPFNDRGYVPGDLIEYLGQREPWYQKDAGNYGIEHIFPGGSRLTHLMNRAHRGASGGEKQDIAVAQQPDGHQLWFSTPFGWEIPAPSLHNTAVLEHPNIDDLRQEIEKQIRTHLTSPATPFPLSDFARALRPLLSQAIADTERPLNDVTIWDIGHTGMAFLVTQALGMILTGQAVSHDDLAKIETDNQLYWRILSVRTDGLDYLENAISIADLRVRQRLLHEAFARVQEKLEALLVGVEIYRDENGSFYLFPNLSQDDPNFKAIEGEIDNLLEIDGVKLAAWLSPTPLVSHPQDTGTYVGKYLSQQMGQLPECEYALQTVQTAWPDQKRASKSDKEICVACSLRPQGYGAEQVEAYRHNPAYYSDKAESRNICCICMHRRAGVAERWATGQLDKETVWIDEVADINGRVALISGYFEVDVFNSQLGFPTQKLRVVIKCYPLFGQLQPGDKATIRGKIFTWSTLYGFIGPSDAEIPNQPYQRTDMFIRSINRSTQFANVVRLDNGDYQITLKSPLLLEGQNYQIDKGSFQAESDQILITLDDDARQFIEKRLWRASSGVLFIVDPSQSKREEIPVTYTENSSFARVRRIWETTRHFWQEVLPTDEDRDVHQSLVAQRIGQAARRLEIHGALKSKAPKDKDRPGYYHAYDLVLMDRVKLSVVWDAPNNRFITADNLAYLAKPEQLSQPVKAWLEQQEQANSSLTLEEPTGYGSKNKVWGTITIQEEDNIQEIDQSSYTAAIPILAEPRTFMALVPADKALDILQAIKAKYEREMGKVRNRLPLHLSVVYFHRRTPLRAALDAGRRMLQRKASGGSQPWRVQADATQGALPPEKRSLADGTQQFQQTIPVQLEQDGHSLTWYVPAVMGDGVTPDHWYPYVFVETNGDDSRVSGRTLAFKGQRPTAADPKECWLVHADELKAGDRVYFMLATFDFEWLDASARRFEIAYDAQGKRYGRLTRPYLLDDLDAIRQAWCLIAGPDGLTTSQIHALRDTLDARREAWYEQPGQSLNDDTFRRLCRDALCNAVWGKHPSCVDMDKLTNWAISGLLADVIELYMGIMKEKPQRNSTRQE